MLHFLAIWLSAGVLTDLLLLAQIYLISTGIYRTGEVVRTPHSLTRHFSEETLQKAEAVRPERQLLIPCIAGLVLPPFVLASLVNVAYCAYRNRRRAV